MIPPPPGFTLFPYTTLFRSGDGERGLGLDRAGCLRRARRRPRDACRRPAGRARREAGVRGLKEKEERCATCCSSAPTTRSEEHTSELQSHSDLVCRLLLEKK